MTKVRINIENDRIPPVKKFPVEIFPPEILEIIRIYVDSLNVNIDYACATFLVAFAAAMGSKYCIQVKRGWIEFPSIFLALVGRAGINKSGPLSLFTNPLEKIDFELFKEYKVQLNAFKTRMRSEDGKDMGDPPYRKQIVIKNTTPEALLLALYQNPHGVIGVYDELMAFGKSMNKYRAGSGDEELYLSIFSCKPYSINRKHSDPLMIERPVMSIIGSIQPLVLGRLFDGNRNSNGFTHRFLFAYPDNVKREDLSEIEISKEVENRFQGIISKMVGDYSSLSRDNVQVLKVTFSAEAMLVYKRVRTSINKVINEGANDDICGIYSKMEIYYIRFCLILHVMTEILSEKKGAGPVMISEKTAEKAKKLYDYFCIMALKVHGEISVANDPLSRIPLRFREALLKLPAEFSTCDAWIIFSTATTSKKTMYNYLSQSDLFTQVDVGKYRREF